MPDDIKVLIFKVQEVCNWRVAAGTSRHKFLLGNGNVDVVYRNEKKNIFGNFIRKLGVLEERNIRTTC